MSRELEGKNIAILVTNGFEQVEMTQPRQAFVDAGANTFVISPAGEQVQGWNHYDKADYFQKELIIGKENTQFSTYKGYSSNQKLFFWYSLAREMEQGNVVRVPNDYQLSPDAQQLLEAVMELEFSQKLVFIKDVVGLGAAQTTEEKV